MIQTIGYEKASLEDFIQSLKGAQVDVLVDIRERAQSRRPGFSKTALSASVELAGIEYLHFRELGDPREGRLAARAGDYGRFRAIFARVMATDAAKEAIEVIARLATARNICLLCYECDHEHCHRSIVSKSLEKKLNTKAVHLRVTASEPELRANGRVLHIGEGATA